METLVLWVGAAAAILVPAMLPSPANPIVFIISRRSWGIAYLRSVPANSEQSGSQIDHGGKNGRVEAEGHHRMQRTDAAHGAGFKYDVGGLGGGADDNGKMDKVPIVRCCVGISKIQTALVAGVVSLRKIIEVGVVYGEDDLHKKP